MVKQSIKIWLSTFAAGVVGLVHGLAHYFFGDPASFQAAAVTPVGFTVMIVTFITAYVGMNM